jgi:nickel-dependent lactate racemase
MARRVYGVRVPRPADIVVANSHPCDLDFWQAHKSLYPAERCVRPGGTIIVTAPCPEGVSSAHPIVLDLAGRDRDDILSALDRSEIEDLTGAALALAWSSVRQHAHVSLVSDGICAEEGRALGFRPHTTLQEALDRALHRHGHDSTVLVLPHAPDTLPVF